ncbi:hypothetical protein LOD99_825 [Oopsacas minuta]|uniref:Uncharacterized protein n=1 Tax=Oopsacas minuta TaxID=111878 RepID=A0AAV7K109_9METZ|nr:hypothetical protein LOD99_825 [Oopsacas minuta]
MCLVLGYLPPMLWYKKLEGRKVPLITRQVPNNYWYSRKYCPLMLYQQMHKLGSIFTFQNFHSCFNFRIPICVIIFKDLLLVQGTVEKTFNLKSSCLPLHPTIESGKQIEDLTKIMTIALLQNLTKWAELQMPRHHRFFRKVPVELR